jgi:hypothetical protein
MIEAYHTRRRDAPRQLYENSFRFSLIRIGTMVDSSGHSRSAPRGTSLEESGLRKLM